MNKVIYISRKAKITRNTYASYRVKNKLKSFYHKVGALAFSLTLALISGVFGEFIGLAIEQNPMVIGVAMMLISFTVSMLAAYGKILLPFGILMVGTFNCNYGLANTGSDCIPYYGAAKKIFFMSYYNGAQQQNRFALVNPGTIATTATSATLTGTNTTFMTTFTIGDIVVITGNTQVFQILAIGSNTSMTATVVAAASTTTTTYNQITNPLYWKALVQHPDRTRAIYPSPFLKNAENVRAESTFETFDDNTKQKVLQGVRTFKGLIPRANASPQLQGKMASMVGTDMGMFVVDYANNLHITDTLDGFAYPMRIDQNSFDAVFNPGTAKKGMNLMLEFDIHANEIDANLNIIAASNFGSVNLGNLNGLKDVTVTFSSPTTTTVLMKLVTLFGDGITPTQVHNLAVANLFSVSTGAVGNVWDTTSSADLAISSVKEQTDGNGKGNGQYLVTFAAASASDVLQFGIQADTYDMSAVNVSPVTV